MIFSVPAALLIHREPSTGYFHLFPIPILQWSCRRREKPSRRCFLNNGNIKKKKKKRLMLENSCSRCSLTAQPSRLGSPTFQNQIPVLFLCWKTCGCSRDLAFCGWSVFPQSEARTVHSMGFSHQQKSMESWDGLSWKGSVCEEPGWEILG